MRNLRIKPVTLAIAVAAAVLVSVAGAWYVLNETGTGSTPCAYPTCDLIQADDSAWVFRITNLDYPEGALPWDEVPIKIYAYPNDPETYLYVNYWLQPNQDNLTSEDGLPITQSLLDNDNSDLALVCNVTDVEGNGFVDDGDYFTLVPVGEHSLMPGVTYTFRLLWLGTNVMSSLEFIPPDG